MNSFLITFKPDSESPERGWPMKSLQRLAKRVQRTGRVVEPWRFLNRKDVKSGDRAFLLQQGKRGPAIIGYGWVTDEEGPTWRGIEFEALADPEQFVYATKQELLALDGAASWLRTQASGVRLPANIAAAIESLVISNPRRSAAVVEGKRIPSKDGIVEAAEGSLLLRKHFARERSRALVESKRSEAMDKHGKLACEICNIDLTALYGSWGTGAIECHHTKPVASLPPGYKTHLSDLVLICANCHRVLHKGNYTVASLQSLLRVKGVSRSWSKQALRIATSAANPPAPSHRAL
jgi:predicted HNH restriction endonuclease